MISLDIFGDQWWGMLHIYLHFLLMPIETGYWDLYQPDLGSHRRESTELLVHSSRNTYITVRPHQLAPLSFSTSPFSCVILATHWNIYGCGHFQLFLFPFPHHDFEPNSPFLFICLTVQNFTPLEIVAERFWRTGWAEHSYWQRTWWRTVAVCYLKQGVCATL